MVNCFNYRKLTVRRSIQFALLTGAFALGIAAVPGTEARAAGNNSGSSYDWSGAYIGINAGGIRAKFKNNVPANPGPTGKSGSPIGGVHAGYNIQNGQFVFGGEADFSVMNIRASSPAGSFKENLMSSFRLRTGYAFSRYLAYATAGVALTKTKTTMAPGSVDRWQSGFTGGAGLAGRFNDELSGRIEYLYVDVHKKTQNIGRFTPVGGSDNHILRVGLTKKF